MAEEHGIKITEKEYRPVGVTPPQYTAVFAIGTAPVHLASIGNNVNVPIIVRNMDEAEIKLGYSDDFESYTLCEVMKSHFELYKSPSPVIFVNVLDPDIHKTTVSPVSMTVTGGTVLIKAEGVDLNSVVVTDSEGGDPYLRGVDYIVAYNEDNYTLLSILSSGSIPSNVTSLSIGYDQINPSMVDYTDIIGGTDITTDLKSGLELINDVFTMYQEVPGLIIAPGWSHNPIIAGLMTAKAESMGTVFKGFAITDLDPSVRYSQIVEWKEDNIYTDALQMNTYPKFTYKGYTYHLSTLAAGTACTTDAINSGIPYESPSNKALMAESAVLQDGTQLMIGIAEGGYLNSNGIVTAINLGNGFVLWGNRTGIFPHDDIPQLAFIPVRRMFNWLGNNLILGFLRDIDDPMNKIMVNYVLDKANQWLNTLTGPGFLLGARIEFLSTDNPIDELLKGKMVFNISTAPPNPGQSIEFKLNYDATYFNTLFEQ